MNEKSTSVPQNLNDLHEESATPGERLADAIASFSGSMAFLVLNALIFMVWIFANTIGPAFGRFDPYPFQFLTMAVSLEAIFLSIFVLVSQNRASDKDRLKAELDYQVDVKAETEIQALSEQVGLIHAKLELLHQAVIKKQGGRT